MTTIKARVLEEAQQPTFSAIAGTFRPLKQSRDGQIEGVGESIPPNKVPSEKEIRHFLQRLSGLKKEIFLKLKEVDESQLMFERNCQTKAKTCCIEKTAMDFYPVKILQELGKCHIPFESDMLTLPKFRSIHASIQRIISNDFGKKVKPTHHPLLDLNKIKESEWSLLKNFHKQDINYSCLTQIAEYSSLCQEISKFES